MRIPVLGTLLIATALSACSTVMEANRPKPTDLNRFVVGEDRVNVISELGAPTATVPNGTSSCDIYKLVTHGPGGVGKGAIVAGEAVADVFTLGLAEVVLTPTEAASKSGLHTVLFCYGSDQKVLSIKESDNSTSVN